MTYSPFTDPKYQNLSPYNRRLAWYYRNRDELREKNLSKKRIEDRIYKAKHRERLILDKRAARRAKRSMGPLFDFYGVLAPPRNHHRRRLVSELLGEYIRDHCLCPTCKGPVEYKINWKRLSQLIKTKVLFNKSFNELLELIN